MLNPYSEDFRERAQARTDAGETVRYADQSVPVFPSGRSCGETGSLKPGKMNGHNKRTLSDANADWLRQRIKSGPFALPKLAEELAARGIKTDVRAVWVFVHAEGLSFKKRIDPPSKIGATSTQAMTLEGASGQD